MLPALCARHGAAEVAALTRAVLPALAREPRVTIRVSPHVVAAVEQELARLDPELHGRVVAGADRCGGRRAMCASPGRTARRCAMPRRCGATVAEALAPLDLLPRRPTCRRRQAVPT